LKSSLHHPLSDEAALSAWAALGRTGRALWMDGGRRRMGRMTVRHLGIVLLATGRAVLAHKLQYTTILRALQRGTVEAGASQ
jgi:hypothetical protein